MRVVHILTPGDHFSPRTGSAVPTVVDGLCRYAPDSWPRAVVAVAEGTYAERYDSADTVEYPLAAELWLPGPLTERHVDAATALFGARRWASSRRLAPTVSGQADWPASFVVAHNAPQLVSLIDSARHVPVCYAHNHLLRSYSQHEAGRVLASARAIICVSAALAEQMASRLPPRLRSRIRVVRNGVDYPAFRRPKSHRSSGRLEVAFVGRMIRDKGADVLVEAIRRLHRRDIHLTLVGSAGFDPATPLTPYERYVREAAASLGDAVTIQPSLPRRDVVKVLQRSDVAVVPSRWPEPFALTVLEGMAAGNAVVGSRIGGIPESLSGVGILVRPDDVDDLAAALEALADDPQLVARTAAACVAYAAEHDWAWASGEFHRTLSALL